jgi:hypothetical protein
MHIFRKRFPHLERQNVFPYDLEDAMLMWANLCAHGLHEREMATSGTTPANKSKSIPYFLSNWTQIEDLIDLRDGRGLCAIALFHNFANLRVDQVHPRSAESTLKNHGQLNLTQRITNLLIFDSACEHAKMRKPPWTPEELAGVTGNAAQNEDLSAGASGFRVPLVSYMCEMFKTVQKLEYVFTYKSLIGCLFMIMIVKSPLK